MTATHAGMTSDDFAVLVRDWIATARHPRFERPYTRVRLPAHARTARLPPGERIQDVHRLGRRRRVHAAWAEPVYGIPPEQVVGSTIRSRTSCAATRPVLMRLPEVDFIDDRAGKPVGIEKFLGQRPSPRSATPTATTRCSATSPPGRGPRFGLIVHHTDADREYAYDRDSPVGPLARALDEAPARGWTVVDMKRDWGLVFPPEK